MAGRLQGRIAIVTGGASGIGRAIALGFAKEGARVCVADIDQAKCDSVAAEAGNGAFGCALDVRSRASIDNVVTQTIAKGGQVNTLVNCAGVFGMGLVVDVTEEDFERVHSVNVRGLLFMTQAVAKQMIAQGKGGTIVNVASDAGKRAAPGAVAYSSSKAAAINITQAAAQELVPHGIRVNAIAPGAVRTPMWDYVEQKFSQTLGVPVGGAEAAQVAATPLGRMADPSEFAGPAIFLASDESSYVLGQTLSVDGGMLM